MFTETTEDFNTHRTFRDGVNDTAKDARNVAAGVTAAALLGESVGVGILVPAAGIAIGGSFLLTAAAIAGVACVGAQMVANATERA